MIKCIIIEDEAPARKLLLEFLKAFNDVEVIAECSNGFDGYKQINALNPDVIILDVQMPKLTGFEMLELLENPPLVLFTTAYEQYAIKAFECNATDYLLKPFTKNRFAEAIEKVRKAKANTASEIDRLHQLLDDIKREQGGIDRVVVKSGKKVKILSLQEIICIEAANDYVVIHSIGEQYLKQTSMQQLDSVLPKSKFQRVHRSYIINLTHIESIEAYTKETHIVKLSNGLEVKTSRSGSQHLKKVLSL
jgi:two-component system LytT family response regulator